MPIVVARSCFDGRRSPTPASRYRADTGWVNWNPAVNPAVWVSSCFTVTGPSAATGASPSPAQTPRSASSGM